MKPGEGPSRGLLRDYEPSDGPWFQALVCCAGDSWWASCRGYNDNNAVKILAIAGREEGAAAWRTGTVQTVSLDTIYQTNIMLISHHCHSSMDSFSIERLHKLFYAVQRHL